MSIHSIICFAAAAALAAMCVRSFDERIGRQTALSALAAVLFLLLPFLSKAVEALAELSELGGLGADTVGFVLRAAGTACLTGLAASICRDAGESALGETVQLAGRLMLVLMTLPILKRLVQMLTELIENGFMQR